MDIVLGSVDNTGKSATGADLWNIYSKGWIGHKAASEAKFLILMSTEPNISKRHLIPNRVLLMRSKIYAIMQKANNYSKLTISLLKY